MTHRFAIRVYYEDTDLGRIVYHANYLKFIERGRSEWLRDAGIDQSRLMADTGLAFVVRRGEADYLSPARFDDRLEVVTRLAELHGSRLVAAQTVERDGQVLFASRVTVVCVDLSAMRPHRIPAAIRAALGAP